MIRVQVQNVPKGILEFYSDMQEGRLNYYLKEVGITLIYMVRHNIGLDYWRCESGKWFLYKTMWDKVFWGDA